MIPELDPLLHLIIISDYVMLYHVMSYRIIQYNAKQSKAMQCNERYHVKRDQLCGTHFASQHRTVRDNINSPTPQLVIKHDMLHKYLERWIFIFQFTTRIHYAHYQHYIMSKLLNHYCKINIFASHYHYSFNLVSVCFSWK